MDAPLEVLKRNVTMEAANLHGKTVIQLLWDVEKFFDSIALPGLVRACEKHGFPTDVLVQVLALHSGPRVLSHGGACAEPLLDVSRSILAGCISSTRLARASLRDALLESIDEGGATTGAHVDDINQIIIADGPFLATVNSLKAGGALIQSLPAAGFKMSSKSRVLCNDSAVAAKLNRIFSQQIGDSMKQCRRSPSAP